MAGSDDNDDNDDTDAPANKLPRPRRGRENV
jgi:hypothetical protein